MPDDPQKSITRLLEIMAALRTPVTGCAWDLEQTLVSLKPYVVDEAWEVVDAINRQDMVDLCEELGDLLLQVVFQAQIAKEQGAFEFDKVVTAISDKLIRRHPHVFGDKNGLDANAVTRQWDEIKVLEKQARTQKRQAAGLPDEETQGLLGKVKTGLSPFAKAVSLQEKAASVGFDWPTPFDVLDKLHEEAHEIREVLEEVKTLPLGDVLDEPVHHAKLEEEFGDLLFVIANLARHLKLNPDEALAKANHKFTKRFNFIEQALDKKGKSPQESTLEEMEFLWQEAKKF